MLKKATLDKNILPVILLTFVNSMNLSILTPTLPFVVEKLGQNEIIYGLLLSAYSIFQFVCSPILGLLSDKYGRKNILLITQLGTLLSWVLFSVSYFFYTNYLHIPVITIFILSIARISDGLTGGNSSVISAYVADVTAPEDKIKNFGILEVAMGVGLFFGLAIGSFKGNDIYGYLPTALVALSISCVTLMVLYKFLEESLPEYKRYKNEICFSEELNVLKKLKKYKQNVFLYEIFQNRAILSFTMSFFISIIILHIVQLFGLSKVEIGYTLLGVGVMMILNQTILLKVFIDRLGNFWTLCMAQILIVLGLIGMSFSFNFWPYIFAYFFANLGFSLSLPTTKTMISNNVSELEQGEALGVDISIYALATAFTPMIASSVYFGFKQLGNTNLVFMVMAIFPLIGFLKLFFLQRKFTKDELKYRSI